MFATPTSPLRMEVGQEVGAAVSSAEGSVAPEAAQMAAQRLKEVTKERERWILRREEAQKRKEGLLKLLQLQGAREPKNQQIEVQKANTEVETVPSDANKPSKEEAAVLARKKELRELQARAEAAKEKQQAAASVLTRNLRQLSAKNATKLSTTQQSPLSKRKREGDGSEEQPAKKVDAGTDGEAQTAVAAAPGIDVGTKELALAACFRIATRHLAQTGMAISKQQLEDAFNTYTGKTLEESVEKFLLERFLEGLDNGGGCRNGIISTSGAEHQPMCWQPGRQFLKAPTLIASDADQIQAFIEVEKQVVVDVCDSLCQSNNRCATSSRVVGMLRQKQFLARLLGEDSATPDTFSLSEGLSAWIGVNSSGSASSCSSRISFRSHAQMAGVFAKMETWLQERAETSGPRHAISAPSDSSNAQSSSRSQAGDYFFSPKFSKPFCVENDSVTKQLRNAGLPSQAASKKIDPMKVFCHYELNGVCNDNNCPNYHQNDYVSAMDEANGSSNSVNHEDVIEMASHEVDPFLMSFADYRKRITARWPVVTLDHASLKTVEKGDDQNPTTATTFHPVVADVDVVEIGEQSEDGSSDFIMLNAPEQFPEVGEARYFDDIESKKAYGDSLQAKVEEDPKNTDAWLLLAIYHLELDVGLSDEAGSFSNDVRLQQQLVWLCTELNSRRRGGASRSLNIEEANLKRCLHTLSRALEEETNAYCEALWLLYLHLCPKVTNKQTEIDMVEQAVQFLPTSHALWLRYISTFDFDSVSVAEGIYWRLLQHLSRVNAAEDGAENTPNPDLSILLTAICFHLCIKLWRAGATNQVLKLLSALLQFGDTPPEFKWCGRVRARLCGRETIALCMAFAHLLLFNELPAVIEHWMSASCCESIPIKAMAYTVESLPPGEFHFEEEVFTRALKSYELAFQIYEKSSQEGKDTGSVILSNWVLLLGLQTDNAKRETSLATFFEEKLDRIQQFPTASFTAAKVIASNPSDEEHAHKVMLTMMKQSSEAQFPAALHHYLFACRHFPALVNELDKMFPDVIERLANLLSVGVHVVDKAIQDIMADSSNISKAQSLKSLMDMLLASWMDQLAQLRRVPNRDQPTENALANIYVALDVCHLMGILLKPSAAIDGLQMILCSSSFGALSLEARQLAWMQRFVFQVDLLQHEDSDNESWREQQARLTGLFRKYTSEMSVEAEMTRQVTKRIRQNIERDAIEDAVCDCLYPERSQLLTYAVNLEVCRLCSAAVTGPEKAAFYASLTDTLALSSDFSLALSDVAVHEWELLATRASLRKCLGGTKTRHPQVLQALVAVELRLRNMKAVSSLLESEMQSDPLLLETWRLALGLEILFGEKSEERAKKYSVEMERRQLVLACNTFGDDQALEQTALSSLKDQAATSITLRGLSLKLVPNAVLLKRQLISLDLSGNELTELPSGLNRLLELQQLNASENALVEFPACVKQLPQLKELRLAHNNLVVAPVPALQHLSVLDIRWNAVSSLPLSSFAALKSLKVLEAGGNAISPDELAKLTDLLSSRAEDTAGSVTADVENPTSGGDSVVQAEETKVDAAVSECPSAAVHDVAHTTESVEMEDTEMTQTDAREVEPISASKEKDGDERMEQAIVDSAGASEETKSDPMDVEEVISVDQSKDSEEAPTVIVVADTPDVPAEVKQTKEVIDVDSLESGEEADKEITSLADRNPATSTRTESTPDTTNTIVLSSGDGSSVDNFAEAEDFAQDHSEVTTAASARQQSSHDTAAVALTKLTTYMEENRIDNRAEVRSRNPALWREFLAASLPVNLKLPACRMCFAPNDGHNQRFNSTVLCMHCLEEALQVLKERDELSQADQEDV